MASVVSLESHNSGLRMQGGRDGVGASAVRVMAGAFRIENVALAMLRDWLEP
jgi:hypothetical protein